MSEFGKGRIDIAIPKGHHAPGDTISGNVVLTLKKPVKAREMSISLIGEQKITETAPWVRDVMAGRTGSWAARGMLMSTATTYTVPIFDFKQQPDGQKEYHEGQERYFFEVKIPPDILSTRRQATGRVRWYLLARLDIPRGLDIKKRAGITIG